ncbi:hypothetical protein LINGRAHAP2_LOCUS22873 [Linum grandiflorum]
MAKSLSIFFSFCQKPTFPPFSTMASLKNSPFFSSSSSSFSLITPIPFSRHSLISLSQTRLSSKTPYPLQYDMIISRPTQSSVAPLRRHRPSTRVPDPDSAPGPDPEAGLDDWVDQKLSEGMEMDKSKRKYYSKRKKRMYGTDSEEEEFRKSNEEALVELKPEVVHFHRLHKREEELYFYDALAYPWEKDKHYKMVYQLEKKYFPDQCLDKAFLDPKDSNQAKRSVKTKVKRDDHLEGDKKLLFFQEGDKKGKVNEDVVTHKKVADFFKVLNKGSSGKVAEVRNGGEPFLATRSTGLPPTWDGPYGTVVLVNKPKENRMDFIYRLWKASSPGQSEKGWACWNT